MKFQVTRTSNFSDKKPCEEAKVRYSTINGNKYKIWIIELNQLDELINFNNKYGALVLGKSWQSNLPSIEIYDGYRE